MSDDLRNATPGFFGKLPKHGDFVSRNLAERFIEPWDDWLQGVIAEAKNQLGVEWLETYLVCPIWRFVLGPGVIGDDAWLGALMPSVDRVGRYYPLTVTQPVRVGREGGVALVLSRNVEDCWFEPVEQAMLAVLGDNGMNADELAVALAAGVDGPVLEDVAFASQYVVANKDRTGSTAHWRWPAECGTDVSDAILVAQVASLAERFKPFSAWYARQGHVRAGEFLVMRQLPTAEMFGAMLVGAALALADVPDATQVTASPPSPAGPAPERTRTAAEVDVEAPPTAAPRSDGTDDTMPDAMRRPANDQTEGIDELVNDELARLLSQSQRD